MVIVTVFESIYSTEPTLNQNNTFQKTGLHLCIYMAMLHAKYQTVLSLTHYQNFLSSSLGCYQPQRHNVMDGPSCKVIRNVMHC